MNQEIRNKLRNVVTQCRKLLEDSASQELEGKYGIFAKKDQVTADPCAKMSHLTEEEQAAVRIFSITSATSRLVASSRRKPGSVGTGNRLHASESALRLQDDGSP